MSEAEEQEQSSSPPSSSSAAAALVGQNNTSNNNTSSNNNNNNNTATTTTNLLHSKIRIKSNTTTTNNNNTPEKLSNRIGYITEVKRGGWFVTDIPELGSRPIRAKEFDVIIEETNKEEEEATMDNGGGDDDDDNIAQATNDEEEQEDESHLSDGDKVVEDFDAQKKTKRSQKENGEAAVDVDDDDDDDDEILSDNNDDDNQNNKQQHSHNYDKDRFLKLGTTIKITSGEFKGRICTISERRVGIFLKISVGGDIRLMQPDEIEVIQFANNVLPPSATTANTADAAAATAHAEEEEKEGENDNDNKSGGGGGGGGGKEKEKDFGHKKYIGATVRVSAAVPGRKQRVEATVDNAFSGEWYLVSDPDIVKALDPAQFEVVTEGDDGGGGSSSEGGGKRTRDDSDDDDDDDERDDDDHGDDDDKGSPPKDTRRKKSSRRKRLYSDSEDDDDEEEAFLSGMQYCGEAAVPDDSPKKSLRKRMKQINYAEDMESSDDMESWEGNEEDKEDEEKGKEEEEEGMEVDDEEEEDDDDDHDDNYDDESEKKPVSTNPVVDLTETSEEPKMENVADNAKPGGDTQIATVNSSDNDDDNNQIEEAPVTAAPIILHPKKVDNNKVELLLSGMSHLSPDTRIEIFNRKTGRVMRGEEAILSKDLPTALLNHAEYEPIVPPSAASTENEADDNKKAEQEMPSPVDPNFNPYDSSILIGVTAVVKNGPHKGLTGKITEIQERGRWLLDHESVKTTFRSSDCHFVDDGKVDKGAIAAHYQTKKKTPMPSFVKPGAVKIAVHKDKPVAKVRRVGRTDTNVRVSNIVVPQTRVRASAVEGKRVLVTGGEFRGRIGTISSCIPGGWYLISNLYDDDHELDVLINSEKLELINDVTSQMLPMLGHTHERIKSSIHLKASQLRLSALKEKKQKLSESAADSRAKKHLEEIDKEIKSLTAKIAAVTSSE